MNQQAKTSHIAKTKIYLAVPYGERFDVVRVGGEFVDFEGATKCWYAKPGADLEALAQWLPDNRIDPADKPDRYQAEQVFMDVLSEHGFYIDGVLSAGKKTRVRTEEDKPHQKSGMYFFNDDDKQPSGWYRDYRNDSKNLFWSGGAVQVTDPAVRNALRADRKARKEARDLQLQARFAHHARRCRVLYHLLPDAPEDHPYLVKKKARVHHGVKIDRKGRLVLPLYDENGCIWSLQRISETGFKSFKKGARKHGLFFVLSSRGRRVQDGGLLPIAEGYSTASPLEWGLDCPVVMALDAHNMAVVADVLAKKYPNSTIATFGDEDDQHAPEKNIGRIKAEQVAADHNGFAALPAFNFRHKRSKDYTDWNDLFVKYGAKVFYRQLTAILEQHYPAALPVPALR